MKANSELQRYTMLASFFLPEGILDWFDVVRMEETDNDKPAHELDVLYPKVLHIYLDERDNRQGEELGFVANSLGVVLGTLIGLVIRGLRPQNRYNS